jgi:hypothetical protein
MADLKNRGVRDILIARVDSLLQEAKDSATRICKDSGLELLILEGADLRPTAEPVPQATPLEAITGLQEAAATLRELLGKPRSPRRGQLAKVVK